MRWLKENHDLVEAMIWCVLAIPTILIWRDAVVWVAVMSVYANAKTAHSAWKAERAKQAAED